MKEEKKIKLIKLLTCLTFILIVITFYFLHKSRVLNTQDNNVYDYIGMTIFVVCQILGVVIVKLMNSIENVKEKLNQRPSKKHKK